MTDFVVPGLDNGVCKGTPVPARGALGNHKVFLHLLQGRGRLQSAEMIVDMGRLAFITRQSKVNS